MLYCNGSGCTLVICGSCYNGLVHHTCCHHKRETGLLCVGCWFNMFIFTGHSSILSFSTILLSSTQICVTGPESLTKQRKCAICKLKPLITMVMSDKPQSTHCTCPSVYKFVPSIHCALTAYTLRQYDYSNILYMWMCEGSHSCLQGIQPYDHLRITV